MSTPSSRVSRNRLVRLRNLRIASEQVANELHDTQVDGFSGRWTRRQWAQVSILATMIGLLGAIVPGFATVLAPRHDAAPMQTLSLRLPPLALSRQQSQPGDSWQTVVVERGQTISSIFSEQGIPKKVLGRLLDHPGVRTDLRRLRPGFHLDLDMPAAGGLRAVRYERGDGERIVLTLDGDKVTETKVKRDVDVRTVVLTGEAGKSLFRSARKLGLTGSHLGQLTDEIFKYDIDFDSDIDADDRFSVVVDQTWVDGQLKSTGPVLAAAFTIDNKLYTGFRHNRNGRPEYFTADGRPLKRAFIRMPIPYARLSSSFGARRHPVLGRMRMHKGVDYAAATGTPIQAAGDAVVKTVGWQGGYGRTVVLDHGRGYTTLYAHMSRFSKIRPGQRIAQGTVIGYVGSTGMSTGPHLHYEFRVNGVHRNPLSMTMPPPQPLAGPELASFRQETQRALAKIRTVEQIVFPELLEQLPERKLANALEQAGSGRKSRG